MDPWLLRLPHATGRVDQLRPRAARTIGPLHWASAETASVWNGYMDGAVRSGERAAAEVLERL